MPFLAFTFKTNSNAFPYYDTAATNTAGEQLSASDFYCIDTDWEQH